ncbi:hypothetical protein [Aerococcus viridans]|uniref:Uncharacterized protein n=1 Tax=Aerococcus viridans TaxID=1377 RepID=A0A2J9PP85_9LACT|nr:hypothetical protein [Aerococcus viridans]MCT1797993.1 hypothetical protein [Aerococcus viridans]MEC1386490.1 hypothetical protein [Aerococcus viridans]PNL92169.1 hypothetical protein A6J77_007965 [Aerococcus viridans]SPT62038.1 Uncharacterised protein [Aerococcus viridans]
MKKVYSLLGISLLTLSLAACENVDSALGMYSDETSSSEESASSSTSSESASLNVVEADSSSSSEASADADSESSSDDTGASIDETTQTSEEVVADSSVASEAATAQAMTTDEIESSIIAAEPEKTAPSSEVVPSSEVEDQGTYASSSQAEGNQGAFDNTRARDLLAEAAPLISADSQGAYQSDEYFFLPTLVNEDLAQVDVYRQSPDGQGHTNLIATYRYDAYSGTLMVMDVVSGTWQNTGQ